MSHEVLFDAELIQRYDVQGPRYTSYPTAAQFSDSYTIANYYDTVFSAQQAQRPLSLYVHIPFCDTVCYYCACNKIITNNHKHADTYLQRLYREIEMQAALFDNHRTVVQLHWGGGTPTFLSIEQMTGLMQQLRKHFRLLEGDQGEYSIEVDPRRIDRSTIRCLRTLGFNRVSLGVQDINPEVQYAVNRIQPLALTQTILDEIRHQEFRSVNMDLIYGLPLQTPKSFAETLDAVVEMAPDRLSVFNYAHLPQMFKVQKQIREADLPSPEQKLEILQHTIERLTDAGYAYIGMDHFAKPDDELAIAQKNGSLTRNFQGYSTHGECELLALGVSSIGKIGNHYIQNQRKLDDYSAAIDANRLPIMRGRVCTTDDSLRSAVIRELICHFELDIPAVEDQWGIVFQGYFADAWPRLEAMAADGLLSLKLNRIKVLPVGRLLIRNICMVFDRYLDMGKKATYSRAI